MIRPLLLVGVIVLGFVAGCMDADPGEVPSIEKSPGEESLARARALLRDAPYSSLIVQVDYEHGVEPPKATIQALLSALHNLTEKRTILMDGPSEIVLRQSHPGTNGSWEFQGIVSAHRETQRHGTGKLILNEYTAFLHVVILHGTYPDAAGLQFENAIWIFPDNILAENHEPDNPLVANPETSVMLHEVGHALGLVNNGAPMVRAHEDPASRYHSSNPRSVMSVSADAPDIFARTLSGDPVPTQFDADDLADLAAVRDGS